MSEWLEIREDLFELFISAYKHVRGDKSQFGVRPSSSSVVRPLPSKEMSMFYYICFSGFQFSSRGMNGSYCLSLSDSMTAELIETN